MKPVCEALGLARSNVHLLRARLSSWADGRTQRTPAGDEQLLADIRAQITELPSYGYRRACALVNRHPRWRRNAARERQARVPRDGGQRVAAAEGTAPASVQPAAQRPRRGSDEQHALVLGWLRDQVRLRRDGDSDVRQGLL